VTPIAGTFIDIDGNVLDLADYTSGPISEYSTAAIPCPNELEGDFADPWPDGCDNTDVDFASIPGGDLSAVTAFRIRIPFDILPWPGGASMRFNVPMAAPAGSPPSIAGDPTLFNPAWNSFSHRAREDDDLPGPGGQAIPTSEPRKVGIILEPHYRVGNLIWLDANNDGIAQADEPGIAAVDVQIWMDTDGDGVPSTGDTLINTTTTDTDGKYLFDNLAPGDYYVVVPEGQNGVGGPLDALFQTSQGEEADPNGDGDNNDNGINDGAIAVSGADQTTGLASGIVTLGVDGAFSQSEPIDETLRSDDATDDDDDDFPDTLSNVSIDIGYYRPFNLGNRVWLDNGDDGTGTLDSTFADNGVMEPGENGIDGIPLTLLNAG
ncbi:MAG: hypothetical protein KAG66_15960, partial [Methylococcales bacterium]|nr:hypothetical protein [Methylococcales bacterium]